MFVCLCVCVCVVVVVVAVVVVVVVDLIRLPPLRTRTREQNASGGVKDSLDFLAQKNGGSLIYKRPYAQK